MLANAVIMFATQNECSVKLQVFIGLTSIEMLHIINKGTIQWNLSSPADQVKPMI